MARSNIGIIIVQWWSNVNMRYGSDSLKAIIAGERCRRVENLDNGEVYAFLNRKRNILKLIGNSGAVIVHKLGENLTWDVTLRQEQIFKMALNCFNMDLTFSDRAFSRSNAIANEFEEDHPRLAKQYKENRSSE